MKTKIKIKILTDGCEPMVSPKGDWIDVKSAINYSYFDTKVHKLQLIPLGFAMKLPKGYECIMASRSSSFKNYGFISANGIGVIDNSYCGDADELKVPALFLDETHINRGDRIAQMRIQLNQKATFWQKLKWLFSSGIEIEYVDHLSNNNRGGFGSTGTK